MRSALIKLLALCLAAMVGLAGFFFWKTEQALSESLGGSNELRHYTIVKGASLTLVARDLHRAGILRQPRYFVWYARWADLAIEIKAGEYSLGPSMTAGELLDNFVTGNVVQHALTIVEGWTFKQLIDAINANDNLTHTLDALEPAAIMERLKLGHIHPEGRFFADTYHFPRGSTDAALLKRAYAAMASELAQAWASRDAALPLRSPDEVLTLASIVEKETAVADERPRIAGVFLSRLRRGMRLETDPTVIFGLGGGFDGNLTRRDLERDTPYNTYVRKGLPPTPIAMPGAAAIHAVVHPLVDGALFFVATGDGRHHFSATYAEHQRAVNLYQRRRRKN